MGYGLSAAIDDKPGSAGQSERHRGARRRRLLHDERAGARDRLPVPAPNRRPRRQQWHVRPRPQCIRSASIRVASWRRASSIRILRHSPAATVPMAKRSRRRGSSAPPFLRRALEAGKPALIELKTDAEALTPEGDTLPDPQGSGSENQEMTGVLRYRRRHPEPEPISRPPGQTHSALSDRDAEGRALAGARTDGLSRSLDRRRHQARDAATRRQLQAARRAQCSAQPFTRRSASAASPVSRPATTPSPSPWRPTCSARRQKS